MRTRRTALRRLPERGAYDRATIDAILDEALISHVGFIDRGQPFVIPTLHARVGDRVYIHGSSASRMLRALDAGTPVCLTATLLDGLVLARSAFHHSVNYRSAVVIGTASAVGAPAEKLNAMRAFSERILPGRWDEVRAPSAQELKATRVLSLPIEEASAKVRSGPPSAEPEDDLEVWAGVVPMGLVAFPAQGDGRARRGVGVPASVIRLLDRDRGASTARETARAALG